MRRRSSAALMLAVSSLAPACEFSFPEPTPRAADEARDAAVLVDAATPLTPDAGTGSVPDSGVDPNLPPTAPPPAMRFRSCAEILSAGASIGDGFYQIAPSSSGLLPPIEVYCDMSIDGGGWTLIGRSTVHRSFGSGGTGGGRGEGGHSGQSYSDGEQNKIGWTKHSGSPREEDEPYSLDAWLAELPFQSILIGARGDGLSLSGPAYVLDVGPRFFTNCGQSTCRVEPRAVLGGCMPFGGPAMLHQVGRAFGRDYFFFTHDPTDVFDRGLFESGFTFGTDTCAESGGLDGRQGMIFVR